MVSEDLAGEYGDPDRDVSELGADDDGHDRQIEGGTDEVVARSYVPTAEDPFERELGSFLEAILRGKPTRTRFAHAAKDVELIAELIDRGTGSTDVFE